jgi:hypothetical protein
MFRYYSQHEKKAAAAAAAAAAEASPSATTMSDVDVAAAMTLQATPESEGGPGSAMPPPLPTGSRNLAATLVPGANLPHPQPPYYGRQSVVHHRGLASQSTDTTGSGAVSSMVSTANYYGHDTTGGAASGHDSTDGAGYLYAGRGSVMDKRRNGDGASYEESVALLAGPATAALPPSDSCYIGSMHSRLTSLALAVGVVIGWARNPDGGIPPFLLSFLLLYGIDLANFGRGILYAAAAICVVVASLWYTCTLLVGQRGGNPAAFAAQFCLELGWSVLTYTALCLHGLLLVEMPTHQQRRRQLALWARSVQRLLAGLVPVLMASYCTVALIEFGTVPERVPVATPLTMGCLLALVSCLYRGSYEPQAPLHDPQGSHDDKKRRSSSAAAATLLICHERIHILLARFAPLLLHVAICWNRIMHQFAGVDDLCELVLVFSIPNLVCDVLLAVSFDALPPPSPTSSLRVAALAVASWIAFQQRYLLTLTHSFLVRLTGHAPSVASSTVYGVAAVLSTVASAFLWNLSSLPPPSSSAVKSRAGWTSWLLGEYRDDFVQLGLALAGLFVGRLFGLPWNFTPLPILAFLGLTLWIATRMLRYLVIFLFVVHATGMVVFTYRFAGMTDISISLVGLRSVTLMRFGFLVVIGSVLAGLVAGLAIRSSGGYGYQLLKRVHGVGILMTLYSLLLMVLEITLSKRPVPSNELVGVEFDADEIQDSGTLYQYVYGMGTAFVLAVIATFAMRVCIMTPAACLMVISVNLGKAICFWMESVSSTSLADDESGFQLLMRSLVAATLIWVMFAPRVLLDPLHSKLKRRRSSLTATEVPAEARRTVYLYTVFVLPVTLVSAMPKVLFPLAGLLSDAYQNAFYATFASRSLPLAELLASTVALWGLASLSMMNHYLPDETTGQGLKKLTAFAFLIGSLLFLVSPVIGSGISAKALSNNPYAAVSSLGSQLMRGKQRSGAWGLLSAALATLLALSGPLELRERRVVGAATGHASKDRYLLLRTMIFGLMFGGGVAWFIVLQNLRDVERGTLVFLVMSCLSVACMGTVAAILGYFLDLEAFGDAVKVIQFTLVLTAVLLPVSGISTFFMARPSHWFGSNGWLSTYLAVVSLTYFSTALCLRHRPTKNAATCAVANTLGLMSWGTAVAILYGRYGVSGLDANYDIRLVLGIPASVVGTLLLSPMLLVLEGEASARKRSAVSRLSTGRISSSSPAVGIVLARLRPSNRLYPLFFGSVCVFLAASLYVVCLRGSGLLGFFGGPATSATYYGAGTSPGNAQSFHDLAALARLAVSHSNAMMASSQLAGSGFWTSHSWTGPIVHLGGVLCCIPTLYLNYQQSWYGKMVPFQSVAMALPLLAVPIFMCWGITLLRWAAACCLLAGTFQAWLIRRIQYESNMRI